MSRLTIAFETAAEIVRHSGGHSRDEKLEGATTQPEALFHALTLRGRHYRTHGNAAPTTSAVPRALDRGIGAVVEHTTMNNISPSLKTPRWLRILALAMFALACFVLSFYLIANSNILDIESADLFTVLLGTISLAFVVLSIVVGVLAFFGWQSLNRLLEQRVEVIAAERISFLGSELRGRLMSIQGHLMGEMSTRSETMEVTDLEKLREAVMLCREGYKHLKKVGGPGEYMCLNNLVYYSFLLRDDSQFGFLLRHARDLKSAAEAHGATNLLLTAGCVILKHSFDKQERQEMRKILTAIAESQDPSIPDKQKKEAKLYLTSFPKD